MLHSSMVDGGEKLDPRIRRTRQLLEEALDALIRERRFEDITVGDIAARAGVNRATFYAHFADKYALLNHSLRQHFQRALAESLATPQPNFSEATLRVLILTTCAFFTQFYEHCQPFTRASDMFLVSEQVQAHLCETLAGWLKPSASSPLTVEAAAVGVSWIIFGSVFQWVRKRSKTPPEQVADQVLALLAPGLRSFLID